MRVTAHFLTLLLLLSILTGCGVGVLQTAKTTPKGTLDITLGTGFLYNEMVAERGASPGNFIQAINFRTGLTDNLDMGARLFFMTGALVDLKYNLMPKDSPLAVSLQGGLGGGYDVLGDDEAGALHLPLNVLLSYQPSGKVTPYMAVGYGFYWIFGREPMPREGVQYAARAGHGDGLLQIAIGLKQAFNDEFALLLEYNLYKALVDDPGDGYAFTDSHLMQVGFSF